MKTSESTSNLFTALALAQGEIKNPAFDSRNPHFANEYASLAAVRNAVEPVFAKHGLAILQPLVSTEQGAGCGLVIAHKSGEWIEFDPVLFPAAKPNAHGVAGAMTYARRLSLQVAGACVGDADDDGNTAAALPATPNTAKQVAVDAFAAMSPEQRKFLTEHATVIIDLAEREQAANVHEYIIKQRFDNEEKLALWSLLPSDVRAIIKKAEKAHA